SRLRDGTLELSPAITDALLALVDAVRGMLAVIERSGREGDGDYAALVETLTRLQDGSADQPAEPVARDANVSPKAETGNASLVPTGVSAAEGRVRVDVGLLERLMDLAGELVLARNQILQLTGALTGAAFLSTIQRLNLITTELQEQVMKTRMQPIG